MAYRGAQGGSVFVDAGQTFHVMLLKTNLTLPYTSVYIRLDCGYWSDEAEVQLRSAIEAAGDSEN